MARINKRDIAMSLTTALVMSAVLSAIGFAAGLGISTWTALSETPSAADLFAITDTSDTTGSSAGTSKSVLYKYVIQPRVVNKSTGTTLTDDEMDSMVFVSDAVTTVLPAVEIGQSVCFYSTTAATIIIDTNASDGIVLHGAARLDDGNTIENTSAAAGDFICLIGDSADGWTTLGYSGTWADGGAT